MRYKAKEWPAGLSNEEVGTRLKALRSIFNEQAKHIAEYCGVGAPTYSKYESGSLDITTRSAVRIAEFYKVDLDFVLLGKTDDVPPELLIKLQEVIPDQVSK